MKFLRKSGFVAAVLCTAFASTNLRAADASPAHGKKIAVTMLGDVLRKGKIELQAPATMDAAFVAAGGFSPGEGAGRNRPAKFCILMTRSKGVDENMHIAVQVDRKTRVIRVTDEAWRGVTLKDGDTVIVPVVVR